jgi:hypothetical protein
MSIINRIGAGEFEVSMHRPRRSSYNKGEEGDDNYKKAYKEYVKLENERLERFMNASLDDVGLEDHPNKKAIFDYAWEEGHSSGFHEVYYHLSAISDLFRRKGLVLNAHVDKDGQFMIP